LAYGPLYRRLGTARLSFLGFALLGGGLLLTGSTASITILGISLGLSGLGVTISITNTNMMVFDLPPANRVRTLALVTAGIYGGDLVFPFVSEPILYFLGYAGVYLCFGLTAAAVAMIVFIRQLSGMPRKAAA
jgi:hypothetical protein